MMYVCSCGNRKSGSPYKSAMTKAWMCADCRLMEIQRQQVAERTQYSLKIKLSQLVLGVRSPMAGDKTLKMSTVGVRVPPDAPVVRRKRHG